MLSLWYSVLFCFCIYRLECSKAKVGLGWMERLLNASLLRALLWSSRLILKDNPNHLYYIEHIGIGSWLGFYIVSVMTMYHHIKPIPIIHTKFNILVLGLGFGPMLFQWWPCTIHTKFDILVLGLGLGHMLLQWWPCTIISNQSLSSYSTFWYWVLAFVIWCFSDDHVPSYEINPYHPF